MVFGLLFTSCLIYIYPHQGAKRSNLRALFQDLSNHSLNYLTWFWTVWRIFFPFKHYDLIQNICESLIQKITNDLTSGQQLNSVMNLGRVKCASCFKSLKFLTCWNSFPACLLTEDGQGRQGKAKPDLDAVLQGQKWVEHLVTEIATKMLLPAL